MQSFSSTPRVLSYKGLTIHISLWLVANALENKASRIPWSPITFGRSNWWGRRELPQNGKVVEEDCHVTTRELAEWVDAGKSTIQDVLTQDLQLRIGLGTRISHQLRIRYQFGYRTNWQDNKAARITCAIIFEPYFSVKAWMPFARSWEWKMRPIRPGTRAKQ